MSGFAPVQRFSAKVTGALAFRRRVGLVLAVVAASAAAGCTVRNYDPPKGRGGTGGPGSPGEAAKSDPQSCVLKESDALPLLSAGKYEEAANLYVRLGELMTRADSIESAALMYAKAVKADSKNSRARFYDAIASAGLVFKGFSDRFSKIGVPQEIRILERLKYGKGAFVQSVARQHRTLGQVEKNLARQVRFPSNPAVALGKKLKDRSDTPPELLSLLTQLPVGEAALGKYSDYQDYLLKFATQLEESANTLQELRNRGSIGLRITREQMGLAALDKITVPAPVCAKADGLWSCKATGCDQLAKADPAPGAALVDDADLQELRSTFMAVASYFRLRTAVRMDGFENAILALEAKKAQSQGVLTDRDVKEVLDDRATYPTLLTIRENAHLERILSQSFDVLNGLASFEDEQGSFCPARDGGNHLFGALCVSDAAMEEIRTGLSLLQGPQDLPVQKINEEVRTVRINLPAFLSQVSKHPGGRSFDLRDLFPDEFDAEGRATHFPDSSMAGLFPGPGGIAAVR